MVKGTGGVGQAQHIAHLHRIHGAGAVGDRLVEQRQPVAHRAVGGARDQPERIVGDVDALLGGWWRTTPPSAAQTFALTEPAVARLAEAEIERSRTSTVEVAPAFIAASVADQSIRDFPYGTL